MMSWCVPPGGGYVLGCEDELMMAYSTLLYCAGGLSWNQDVSVTCVGLQQCCGPSSVLMRWGSLGGGLLSITSQTKYPITFHRKTKSDVVIL